VGGLESAWHLHMVYDAVRELYALSASESDPPLLLRPSLWSAWYMWIPLGFSVIGCAGASACWIMMKRRSAEIRRRVVWMIIGLAALLVVARLSDFVLLYFP